MNYFGPGSVKTNLVPGPVNANLVPGPVNRNWGPRPVNTNWGRWPGSNKGPWGKQRAWGREIQIPLKDIFFYYSDVISMVE